MVSSTRDNSTPSHAPRRQLIRNLTSVNLLTSDGQARLHTRQNGGRQGVYKEMHARIGKKPARTEQFFFKRPYQWDLWPSENVLSFFYLNVRV